MIMKYKDFKMLSYDDMKQIVGGNAPDEGANTCRVTCPNNTTLDCMGSTSCNYCSTTTTSCTGYTSCQSYTYNCTT
jgi:hypothetical protein